MTQVSKYKIEGKVYQEIFDTFLSTIAKLNTKKTVLEFFSEFLTPTEIIMFSKRLAVGLLVAQGFSYNDMKYTLKMSGSTISHLSNLYKYANGYRKVVDNIRDGKEIKNFFLSIAEGTNIFGGPSLKGSGTWRSISKAAKNKKSKLIR